MLTIIQGFQKRTTWTGVRFLPSTSKINTKLDNRPGPKVHSDADCRVIQSRRTHYRRVRIHARFKAVRIFSELCAATIFDTPYFTQARTETGLFSTPSPATFARVQGAREASYLTKDTTPANTARPGWSGLGDGTGRQLRRRSVL